MACPSRFGPGQRPASFAPFSKKSQQVTVGNTFEKIMRLYHSPQPAARSAFKSRRTNRCHPCALQVSRPHAAFHGYINSHIIRITCSQISAFHSRLLRSSASWLKFSDFGWSDFGLHTWSGILMLHLVAPYVAEMLHLKTLTINRVAGVAGFQSISTCKIHIKSFIINVVAGVFDGFLILPYRQPTRPTATNGRPNPAFGGKPAKSSPIKPNQGELWRSVKLTRLCSDKLTHLVHSTA